MVTTILAPAKLTLSLRMTGLAPNGYHLIDAEMVTVDLYDTLEIHEGETGLSIDGGGPDVRIGPTNLISQALLLAAREARVHVTKRIPSAAGLGGGSSDAGAILRWAGFTDTSEAVKIGADVAFCLVGGRARVTGIGDLIEPLEFVPLDLTLVTPPIACPTPAVFAKWDDMGGPQDSNNPNDLESAAIEFAPELARWRDELGDSTGETPTLAGSGSTWFVKGHYPGDRRVLVSTIPSQW